MKDIVDEYVNGSKNSKDNFNLFLCFELCLINFFTDQTLPLSEKSSMKLRKLYYQKLMKFCMHNK